jgi:hypothetical protein
MYKAQEGLTCFQRAKQVFGVAHPAEQLLILEHRVAKLEKLITEMLRPESLVDQVENSEVDVVLVPKKMGRPKGSKNL